jgi:hypothetical protein
MRPIRKRDQTTVTGDTSLTASLVAMKEPPQTAMAAINLNWAVKTLDDFNEKCRLSGRIKPRKYT